MQWSKWGRESWRECGENEKETKVAYHKSLSIRKAAKKINNDTDDLANLIEHDVASLNTRDVFPENSKKSKQLVVPALIYASVNTSELNMTSMLKDT